MILLPRRKLLSGAAALALLLFLVPCAGRAQDQVVRHKAFVAAHGADTFTTSGTWVAPAGVTSVDVECWGGGGGGATHVSGAGSAGAGGGAYSKKLAITVVPGNSYTVTVGAGGASGNPDGVAGGDTSFIDVSTILAKGGSPGRGSPNNGTNPAGGAAGSGVGDTKYSGGTGGKGDNGYDGGGGGSSAGTGANGGNGGNTTAGSGHPGAAGTAPTGGGAGGAGGGVASNPTSPSAPGGGAAGCGWISSDPTDGAAGKVIVTY